MSHDQYILSHYKNIARQYGTRADSTLRDKHIRSCEVDFVLLSLYEYMATHQKLPRLLDLGCGNGYLISVLHDCFPEMEILGVEFSPELLAVARSRNLMNCEFRLGDIREQIPQGFDVIISERVIINLLSRKQQIKALKNIYHGLSLTGEYLMLESFADSLHELNVMLEQNNLDQIIPSKHNFFIPPGVFREMDKIGFSELEPALPSNFLSTYFVLTRVFHPLIRSKNEKRLNNKLINFFTKGLKPDVGSFSPLRFHRFARAK